MTKNIEKIEEPKIENKENKTKKSKDTVQKLDEMLFGRELEEIDMGEIPDFMGMKPNKKEDKNIPDFLKY